MAPATALAAPVKGSKERQTCGPPDAATVVAGRRGRVYLAEPPSKFDPRLFGVGGDARLYGCLVEAKRSWRLDRRFENFTFALFMRAKIEFHAPWVALAQTTVEGVDSGHEDVIAVNLWTGKSRVCPVNGTLQAGGIDDVVVTRTGRVGWLAEVFFRSPTSPYSYELLPMVGACTAAGTTILDSGPQVDPHFLERIGSVLMWVSDGEPRFYDLEKSRFYNYRGW